MLGGRPHVVDSTRPSCLAYARSVRTHRHRGPAAGQVTGERQDGFRLSGSLTVNSSLGREPVMFDSSSPAPSTFPSPQRTAAGVRTQ